MAQHIKAECAQEQVDTRVSVHNYPGRDWQTMYFTGPHAGAPAATVESHSSPRHRWRRSARFAR